MLRGREVGEIVTTTLADPPGGAAAVRRLAEAAGVGVRAASDGETTTIGPLRWRVIAPTEKRFADSDSPPNDASVVLLVEVRGLRILMTGDQERPSQGDLRRRYAGLRADVLKVAHHGSSKQDAELVAGLGARLAVISVGAGNDYGHPAAATLDLLRRSGMTVRRTDTDGDVAVVLDGAGRLGSVVRAVRP